MSEEQLVKDGALFFNAPDNHKRKPNVIYYNTAAETTGIEYTKSSGVEKPSSGFVNTTWFKIVMSITGMMVTFGIVSAIYFLVVKLCKKETPAPKEPNPEDTPDVYGNVQPTASGVEVTLEDIQEEETPAKDVWFIQRYFESLLPSSVKQDSLPLNAGSLP